MDEQLLDRTRRLLRTRYSSYRTEQAYRHWARRFILHDGKRHPRELAKQAVEWFLCHLATEQGVAPSTQNQALNALLFLYRHVLALELPWLDSSVGAWVGSCFMHTAGLPRRLQEPRQRQAALPTPREHSRPEYWSPHSSLHQPPRRNPLAAAHSEPRSIRGFAGTRWHSRPESTRCGHCQRMAT